MDLVEKARARVAEHYLLVEPWSTKTFQLDVAAERATVAHQSAGYRATSLDSADILIISTLNFLVSRLAPYMGWESFYARASRDWEVWKRVAGYRRVQRIGVRYINRIDIPCEAGQKIQLEDYFTCYPEAPEVTGFPGLARYAMQLILPSGPEGCSLMINGASVPSPLVNHASFLLDLDISKEGDAPQNDDQVWALIDRTRDHKNRAFESCITDRARALFY